MLTQEQIIDALQFNLAFDGTGATTANPYQITYQFADSQPGDLSSQYTGWESWNAAEKANYRAALDQIESIVNIEFVEVTGQADPTLNVGKVDFNPGLAGLGGLSYSTRGGQLNSIDNFTLFNNTINMANATNLILHELGHSLGLDHPFEGAAQLPAEFDNNKYTVMSYDRNPENNQDSDALMLFDILALQDIWGANTNTDTGNNTYTGSRTANMDTIWDAGGVDTLDASARTNNVILNLNAATFSRFGSYDDVSIAFGVDIERAIGGSGNDTITGNTLANTLRGGAGNDALAGDDGNDKLYDDAGNDTVSGGDGDDYIRVGGGQDSFDGGAGIDTISYYSSNSGVLLDLAANTASRAWAADDTITGFENASGSQFGSDTMLGTDAANKFIGYGGSEYINGRGGDDFIYGGTGNDKLIGATGDDRLYGGSGADRLYGNNDADRLIGGSGNDQLYGGNGLDNLYGGDGADTLDGGSGNDNLFGGSGNDKMYGGAGNDKVFGGAGADTVDGGSGQDLLYGGDANDFLSGGNAQDTLHGGAGSDRLAGNASSDILFGGTGADTFVFNAFDGFDTIKDFANNADTLELSGFTGVTDAASALGFATDRADGVLFQFGSQGTLLIEDITKADLFNDIEIA